jgi:peptide/nickel transport system permease protein
MSAQPILEQRPKGDIVPESRGRSPDSRSAARILAAARKLLKQPSLHSAKMRLGLGIVGFFIVVALVGPLLIHGDPTAFSADQLQPPSWAHWLGTTQTGQDIFSQVVLGARATLLVGFATGVLATTLSVIIGLSAGYFGGVVDELLSLLINVFLVMPALPLAIVLAGYVPVHGPLPVALVISFTGWSWGARVLRSQTLSLRRREFVQAAQATGERWHRIIFWEILPNETAIVASGLVFTIIFAILAEIGLEFLGLSDVTLNSWGNMLYWAGNNNALLLGAWWWFLPPGLCIALLGAGLAFINSGIDEITNPRLRDASRA